MQSGGYSEENDPELNGNYEEESSVIENKMKKNTMTKNMKKTLYFHQQMR